MPPTLQPLFETPDRTPASSAGFLSPTVPNIERKTMAQLADETPLPVQPIKRRNSSAPDRLQGVDMARPGRLILPSSFRFLKQERKVERLLFGQRREVQLDWRRPSRHMRPFGDLPAEVTANTRRFAAPKEPASAGNKNESVTISHMAEKKDDELEHSDAESFHSEAPEEDHQDRDSALDGEVERWLLDFPIPPTPQKNTPASSLLASSFAQVAVSSPLGASQDSAQVPPSSFAVGLTSSPMPTSAKALRRKRAIAPAPVKTAGKRGRDEDDSAEQEVANKKTKRADEDKEAQEDEDVEMEDMDDGSSFDPRSMEL